MSASNYPEITVNDWVKTHLLEAVQITTIEAKTQIRLPSGRLEIVKLWIDWKRDGNSIFAARRAELLRGLRAKVDKIVEQDEEDTLRNDGVRLCHACKHPIDILDGCTANCVSGCQRMRGRTT